MKIKVSDLTDAALDWAVAKALELQPLHHYTFEKGHHIIPHPYYEGHDFGFFPSTEWAQGGPLIEQHLIRLDSAVAATATRPAEWRAHMWRESIVANGPTPLVAVMRCVVVSRLGDEVEIPWELA